MPKPAKKTPRKPSNAYHPYNSSDEQYQAEQASLRTLMTLEYPTKIELWKQAFVEAYRATVALQPLDMKVSMDVTVPRAHESVLHRVYLGMRITPKSSLVTYCLAICDIGKGAKKVVRKFHFDIETSAQNERKPMSHLQFGGGLPTWLQEYENAHFQTPDALCEKPRVPCLPPSFAMLANWVLMEYQHVTGIREFISKPEWIGSVRKAEEAVLRKYFQHGNEHFGTSQGEKRCLGERCYL